jgi:hypothetical protein
MTRGLLIESLCDNETDTNPKRERGILRFWPRSRFGLVLSQHAARNKQDVDLMRFHNPKRQ